MKLWVGQIQGNSDLWVIDQEDPSRIQDDQVWIFRVSLNTWQLFDRIKYRKLLKPVSQESEYELACRAYKRKWSELHNSKHQFGDGISNILDMRWAGGGSGDVANVRRKFE